MTNPILLIGTWRALLAVNLRTKQFCPVDIPAKYNWGITFSKEHLICCQWFGHKTVFVFYDQKFRKVKVLRPDKDKPITAPHQINWIDNKLWVVNSEYDMIDIWDGEKWTEWRHHPNPDECYTKKALGKLYGTDKLHYNGIWRRDDKLFITAHNRGDNSFINEYDFKSLKFIRTHGTIGDCCHNTFPHRNPDGDLAICDSKNGRIISVKDGSVIAKTGGYPRGVVMTPEYKYIAVSPHHFKCSHRNDIDGEIQVYDSDWKLVETFTLRGFGQLYEMRILHEIDYAHYPGCENVMFDSKRVNWQESFSNNHRLGIEQYNQKV